MNFSRRHCPILFCGGLALSSPCLADTRSDSGTATPQSSAGSKTSVVLSPFVVSTKPIGSFGLSVKAMRGAFSTTVAELTILDVVPHTDADKEGLVPLTRILSIDGTSISEFTASFDKGSDLCAKLIDRKRGAKITLEVLILGASKSKLVTLTEGHGVHQFPNQSDSEVEPLRTMHIGLSH
jgi:predicted metalloprotease with PDZ domain